MRACQVGGVLCAGDSRQAVLSATLLRWLYLLLLTNREALGWVLFRSSPAKKRVLNINGYLVSKAPCTCARSK